jgi:hypothetical protein
MEVVFGIMIGVIAGFVISEVLYGLDDGRKER